MSIQQLGGPIPDGKLDIKLELCRRIENNWKKLLAWELYCSKAKKPKTFQGLGVMYNQPRDGGKKRKGIKP